MSPSSFIGRKSAIFRSVPSVETRGPRAVATRAQRPERSEGATRAPRVSTDGSSRWSRFLTILEHVAKQLTTRWQQVFFKCKVV